MGKKYTIKVGDFSQAQKSTKKTFPDLTPSSDSMELTLTNLAYIEPLSPLCEDLDALARIVFAMFTNSEKSSSVSREEIANFPDKEIGILILALQNGMSAEEALKTAPFHTAEEKKSVIR